MVTNLAWIVIAATGIGTDRPGKQDGSRCCDRRYRVARGRPVTTLLRVCGLRALPAGTDWTAGTGTAAVPLIPSIEMGGRTLPVHWRLVEQRTEPKEDATIFRFVCDRPALELRSIWRAHPGPGPVEHTIFITNREAQEILLPLQPTLAFSFMAAPGHTIEQWWVERGGSRPSDVGTHRDRIERGNVQLAGFDSLRRRTDSLAERAGRRGRPRLVRRHRVLGLRAHGVAGRPREGCEKALRYEPRLGLARATPRSSPTAPAWPPARPSRRRRSSSAATAARWTTEPIASAVGSSGICVRPAKPICRCW